MASLFSPLVGLGGEWPGRDGLEDRLLEVALLGKGVQVVRGRCPLSFWPPLVLILQRDARKGRSVGEDGL